MYFKLAFRNAKRSIIDYILYIFTLIILLAVMSVSSYIAIAGNMRLGFRTLSLPALIILILIILVRYVNEYMLKQRSKEFANYLLMGMEKAYLTKMFAAEFIGISLFSFLLGHLLCYAACSQAAFLMNSRLSMPLYIQSSFYGLVYFIVIELFSVFIIIRRINKLQIRELMNEKKQNQKPSSKYNLPFWRMLFFGSFVCLLLMFWGIAFLSKAFVLRIISVICIPLFLSIYSFYNWLFHTLVTFRKKHNKNLYQKERLYFIGRITSAFRTNAILNTVFCCCLLLSAAAFITGVFMFKIPELFSDRRLQNWMGFLQICISVIFIVIFFSILSSKEIMENQNNENEIKLLTYLGKDKSRLRAMFKKQTHINILMPASVSIIILTSAIPPINYRLNTLLSNELKNLCLSSIGIYGICFSLLYFCYYTIVYTINTKNLIHH